MIDCALNDIVVLQLVSVYMRPAVTDKVVAGAVNKEGVFNKSWTAIEQLTK